MNKIISITDGWDSDESPAWSEKPKAPAFSDEDLALRFVDRHGDSLRFVAAWGKWFNWNGTIWTPDETMLAFDLSRAICRQAATECKKESTAQVVSSAKTVAAVERMTKADRKIAATLDQWDADPDVLNGALAVGLATGETSAPNALDYCTKSVATKPTRTANCPNWYQFLDRVTGGNNDLVQYLQRVVGYCLTGHTNEHALFFLYGTGANGKSVFVNTIAGLMGDYAMTAPMDTFVESKNERHPTELAMLRGARLVTASETQAGRHWNEALIKVLTGGDRIRARFMRQDFFEYQPVFKLMVSGNHKPAIRNVDEAIRRRLHLIPFTVTIPKHERDPELSEKLKREWPGILQWAINGCLAWREMGLQPPEAVRQATDEYLEAEDDIVAWLGECCMEEPAAQAGASELYASWKKWTERTGRAGGAGSQKSFSQALLDKGWKNERTRTGRVFFGLRVVAAANDHGY